MAMLVERVGCVGTLVATISFLLPRLQGLAVEKRQPLLQDSDVSGCGYVVCGDERKPEQIIGDPRANAFPRRRVPPVQYIAGLKLTAGCLQDMGASPTRRGQH